ncbi:MAG: hypothetical protein V1776_03255 [Candidatus Diapherotrites archaeon]
MRLSKEKRTQLRSRIRTKSDRLVRNISVDDIAPEYFYRMRKKEMNNDPYWQEYSTPING